jgi:hypothetical protein
MWYVAPPTREKKAAILINIESEDDLTSKNECPHMKKVNPYVQMFNIITTIFSLITFLDIFMFRFAIYKRDWLQWRMN